MMSMRFHQHKLWQLLIAGVRATTDVGGTREEGTASEQVIPDGSGTRSFLSTSDRQLSSTLSLVSCAYDWVGTKEVLIG